MRDNSTIEFSPRPREDEIHDLSPTSFRFLLAILFGIAVLLLAGAF